MSNKSIVRSVGDNYPISGIIKINGAAVDITGADIVFIYKHGSVETTIHATITNGAAGAYQINFGVNDLNSAGEYTYKIKRIQNSITTTHAKGVMVIE